MKLILQVLVSIIITYSLQSFAVSAPTTATDNFYTEDKQSIFVNNKQPQFTIKLKSNPTTGYSWFLREYDSNLITPLKHSFQHGTKNLIGAPGYEFWTFKVKPAGFNVPQQTTIRLIYARPWQMNDNSTQLLFRVTTEGE